MCIHKPNKDLNSCSPKISCTSDVRWRSSTQMPPRSVVGSSSPKPYLRGSSSTSAKTWCDEKRRTVASLLDDPNSAVRVRNSSFQVSTQSAIPSSSQYSMAISIGGQFGMFGISFTGKQYLAVSGRQVERRRGQNCVHQLDSRVYEGRRKCCRL